MTDTGTQAQTALAEAVRALREDVARLADRISALEAAAAPVPSAAAGATGQVEARRVEALAAEPAGLSEDLVLVISAAIAAYLGKKPYIRQIRLVTSPTWTHQGRVSIQASHALAVRHRSGAAL